jgi:hypothetical protein
MHGPELLKAFIDRNHVTRDACAKALKVTRTTLYYWLTDKTAPGEKSREDIAIWTNGEVPEASWGPSVDHRKAKATPVEPFAPDAGQSAEPTRTH